MKIINKDNFPLNKTVSVLFRLVFLFINLLFIFKYGSRQHHISVYLVLLAYTLFCGFLLFKKDVVANVFFKKINIVFYYKILCVSMLLGVFSVTFLIDKNSLHVDRWSAMNNAIEALLRGEYPYTATDHLNGRTSNFPGLLILGIPFYLLGNVGYLQVFSFLLLSYTLNTCLNINKAFRYISFLLISPAFWWEIFAISDLMSNIVIVLCFVLLWKQKIKDNIFKYPLMLGVVTAFLVLTRGIVVIPLVLLVFRDFWKLDVLKKVKYLFTFALTFVFLIAIVLMNCPDLETLENYNPYVLQTGYLPGYVQAIALLLPFYFTFKIQDFNYSYFKTASILLLFPVFTAFFFRLYSTGFSAVIEESTFDLSYLSIVIPFLLIEVVEINDEPVRVQTDKV
jgi:hypothetical protein